jgi:hypothetical protein
MAKTYFARYNVELKTLAIDIKEIIFFGFRFLSFALKIV